MTHPEPRFTDQELRLILQRAAEMEAGLLGARLLAAAVAGGLIGAATGRGIWHLMARESRRTARKIASELAATANELRC